ncbi:MAG TPA: hypothetical protein VJI96_00955 [Candidatus Andersenbacteria bacterium]|nr:hypothetical protein [Candidatus Andersenbacteria bacterium]
MLEKGAVLFGRKPCEVVSINPDIDFLLLAGVRAAGKKHLSALLRKHYPRLHMIQRVQTSEHGYGVSPADIDCALNTLNPSVVHLHHSAVETFQNYVRMKRRRPAVLSFLVTCDDEETLRRRTREVDTTIRNLHLFQRECRESELYHYEVKNEWHTSEEDLLDQVIPLLSQPIPRPRKFRTAL